MKRRIACLIVAGFFIDVCRRANPSLTDRPVAIADGLMRREIIAHNRLARGVEDGMTPKAARAACLGLVVIGRNQQAERKATQELLDALESCGPSVEALRPGVYFFDAAGLPKGEVAALGAAAALAAALGFTASAAVADDKFTAQCAAQTGGGCSIVPPGQSAAFLAPLPVSLLPLVPGDAQRFDMLGLRVLGQIAALATAPLAARFGERARQYVRLARGQDSEPLRPRSVQTVYEDRVTFESAVHHLEPLFFALRTALSSVAGRLAGAAQVCDRFEIVLDPGGATIPVSLAEATLSAAVMFDLGRIALESREQLEAVESIGVRVSPCSQAPPQLGLFDGARGSRMAAVAATLARLQATLAHDEVVTLATQCERSRLPERMQRSIPVTSCRQFASKANGLPPANSSQSPEDERCRRPALRLVDPPKAMAPPSERCARAGPFRLSESWWDRPVERDYYQVWQPNGALVLAFHDLREGGWYVQGIFD